MKHIKLYKNQTSAIGDVIETPAFIMQEDEKCILPIPASVGKKVTIIKDTVNEAVINFEKYVEKVIEDTTKFIGDHGGMLATFNFDGTNNVIGGSKLYNKLLAVYLDGVFYDIDDLVVNVSASGSGSGSASGSASGSGSGSSMSGIAFPNTITGEHEVEYVLELDSDGTLDISSSGWFDNCLGMTSVTLPNFINGIDNKTFKGSINITTAIVNTEYAINKNFNKIFNEDNYNTSTIEKLIIGKNITIISSESFMYSALTSITIPSSVTSIGESAFSNCTGLISITIPDSVTSIGDYVFRDCTGLISITIPDSVTSIGNGAFWNCTGLTSITIPSSVTSIFGYAFAGCTSLTSVTIPDSVTSIEDRAFYNVAKVIYSGTATGSPWGAKEVVTSE